MTVPSGCVSREHSASRTVLPATSPLMGFHGGILSLTISEVIRVCSKAIAYTSGAEYNDQMLRICILVAGISVASMSSAQTVDEYVGAAKLAAGTEWAGTFLRLCVPPPPAQAGTRGGPRGAPARETWYAEPGKAADNLYFLGTKIHNAWAIVGSQGIILVEALFDYAANDEILGGMKKLGLDKSKVKYVILSHAHADHDGGAKLLQDELPGAHLIYGAADWEAVDKSTNHAGGKPKHDLIGDDGMNVSVGDASVRIIAMPGHTPGTLSYLFEVRDHGKPLRVVYVGGTAVPFNGTAAYYDGYIASSKKVADAAAAYGATALLSNHSEFDDAYFKAHSAANRQPGEATSRANSMKK